MLCNSGQGLVLCTQSWLTCPRGKFFVLPSPTAFTLLASQWYLDIPSTARNRHNPMPEQFSYCQVNSAYLA
uniref:Uncharacterized protein n=1 Tax=Anguilla anguilla TaxID=7936 RepID=A0A0E9VGW9_ANGAN